MWSEGMLLWTRRSAVSGRRRCGYRHEHPCILLCGHRHEHRRSLRLASPAPKTPRSTAWFFSMVADFLNKVFSFLRFRYLRLRCGYNGTGRLIPRTFPCFCVVIIRFTRRRLSGSRIHLLRPTVRKLRLFNHYWL